MKKINNTKKSSFLKKLFVKLCRLIGFEIIDQSSLNLPVSNRLATDNLGNLGEGIITIPLGETKILRSVKSLDIIIKTCTSVNLVTQNKKRVFEKDKSEYTFRTINSLINSLKFGKEFLKNIKIKIHVIDYNSKDGDLEKIRNILNSGNIEFEITNLNLEKFTQIKTLHKGNLIIENNMKATMASILTSFNIAKNNCDDLIYFVEDDYIHENQSISEMLFAYERIASLTKKDLIMCPTDYPFLYMKADSTKLFLGENYHWRQINETLCTFLMSKQIVDKHWDKLTSMCKQEHYPFESPLHDIYKEEICISPVPSLSIHCTNTNSAFGLSPNKDWKKLWEENKV